MKPAPFAYRAPDTVAEALGLLAEAPDERSLLAGGQSLVPMMSMRIARPEMVIDLGRIVELAGVERSDGIVRIGAMTRQRTVELNRDVIAALPLLPVALEHVAHIAIRTRGTIGGSIAHADPSAELPATAIALGGRLRLRSRAGARVLAAEDFFVAPLMTAIEPGELIEAVELPVPPAGTGWGFAEVARTHGAFALVGAVAQLGLDHSGAVTRARLAMFGVGATPVSVEWLEPAVRGRALDNELLAEVGSRLSSDLEPLDDVQASSAYRRRAAGRLAQRVLRQAMLRANPSEDEKAAA